MKGHSLREWVSQANNRTAIKQRFAKFLTTYTDQQGHSVYAERIKAMGLRAFLSILPGRGSNSFE